jgi:methyl-accepting chemotaxis protein
MVAQTLNAIVTKVRQVDELVSEVASASKEQTEGIGQVNAAIAQMDKVTQSNAATAEESAAAAQELNAQAELMKQSVAELLQLVAGNNQTAEPNTAASSRPTQRVQAKQSAAIRPAKTTHRNGNGALALNLPVKRPNDLPMIGDFKDF